MNRIGEFYLRSTRANLRSHTVKKFAAKSKNSVMLQDQILLTCKRHLKLIKKILQHFCSTLRAPTALVIGVCLSRTPKLFAKDSFLSLDFATNTLIN